MKYYLGGVDRYATTNSLMPLNEELFSIQPDELKRVKLRLGNT